MSPDILDKQTVELGSLYPHIGAKVWNSLWDELRSMTTVFYDSLQQF